LDREQSANQKIERQLTIGDHQVAQKHKSHDKETVEVSEFAEVVETQRHQLEKLDSDARAYQAEIDDLRTKTAQENAKRESHLQRLRETQNAMAAQQDQTEDLDEQTEVMNEFFKKEEVQLKQIESAIDTEKNYIFKLSQEVFQARKGEKNLLSEIQGSQSRAKNLALKIQEFDRETQKQMELLYNSNFQIQQLERKIARIEGERTEEEKLELQAQIDQLTRILDGKLETEKLLTQQLQRQELELRQTQRRKEKLEKIKSELETKLNELHLDQESLDKSALGAQSRKQSVLVKVNMMRLQVEKLGEQVASKSDELISLENRRQQLQLSMEERLHEIDGHLAALKTQIKVEEEARHSAVVELAERRRRAETLASKYHVDMGKYLVDGQEVSQSYHVIRFAKAREEVSRKGDELEQQVKTAVRELRSLEREMHRLNGQNLDFRKSFTAVGEEDGDLERKRVLEEQVRVAQQRLNARRAEAHAAGERRAALEATYQQQQARITQMQGAIMKAKPVIDRLAAENRECGEKLGRAVHALAKTREAHRAGANIPPDANYPASLLEMDVELRMLRAEIDSGVAELTKFAEANREIDPKLRIGLTQIGLAVKPPPPRTAAGSRSPPNIISPTASPSGSSKSTGRSSGSSTKSRASTASPGSTGSRGSVGSRGSGGSRGSLAAIHNISFPG
jgi:chromosome segregation ATPase